MDARNVEHSEHSLGGEWLYRKGELVLGPVRGAQLLDKLYASTVKLQTGESVPADEAYLRESILYPAAKVTSGYQPVMPAFQGIVTEEQLLALIEYEKSLSLQQPAAR